MYIPSRSTYSQLLLRQWYLPLQNVRNPAKPSLKNGSKHFRDPRSRSSLKMSIYELCARNVGLESLANRCSYFEKECPLTTTTIATRKPESFEAIFFHFLCFSIAMFWCYVSKKGLGNIVISYVFYCYVLVLFFKTKDLKVFTSYVFSCYAFVVRFKT